MLRHHPADRTNLIASIAFLPYSGHFGLPILRAQIPLNPQSRAQRGCAFVVSQYPVDVNTTLAAAVLITSREIIRSPYSLGIASVGW